MSAKHATAATRSDSVTELVAESPDQVNNAARLWAADDPARRLRSAPRIVSTDVRARKSAQRKLTGRGCWLRASKLLICLSASSPVKP
jgi:hypothetical protein